MWTTTFSYGETWNVCCVSEHCSHSQKSPPVTRHSWVFAQEQCPRPPLYQCHWWGITNKQLLPPHQWSPQPSCLRSRPMRVEIASSHTIWLPILRKKIITIAGHKQRWVAKSFFLHAYYIIVWFLLSWTKDELCSSTQSTHGGLQVFIIYCSLRRSTLKAAWGSRLCFIHHMTHFPAALSSTSVTSDRAD